VGQGEKPANGTNRVWRKSDGSKRRSRIWARVSSSRVGRVEDGGSFSSSVDAIVWFM